MNARLLPDELVRELLAPLILVPDSKFFNVDDVSPFATPSPSCSAYLVVCKQWMRVATPLLYDCVVVRSKAQAQAMATVLKNNPTFGLLAKKLRVEGGFGMHMNHIIASCPNVSDLLLSLQIWSPDTVSGLTKGLGTMKNIQRLAISAGSSFSLPTNKAAQSLTDALSICIQESWNSMRTLRCSWDLGDYNFGRDIHSARLKAAIYAAPTLVSIQLRIGYRLDATTLEPLLDISSLKRICFVVPSDYRSSYLSQLASEYVAAVKIAVRDRVIVEELRSDARVPDVPPAETLMAPTLVSFVPLQGLPEALQDAIWGRVIYFACEGGYVYSNEELMPGRPPRTVATAGGPIRIQQARLRIALVSKPFYRLARGHLHCDLHLQEPTRIYRLAMSLLDNPQMGSEIRTLYLDFGTTSLEYVGHGLNLDLVSLSARIEDALSERPEDDAHSRHQEIQCTTKALQPIIAWRAEFRVNKDAEQNTDLALNFKVYHQSLEFIFAECTGLLKLSSSRRFTSDGVIPVNPSRTNYTSVQEACPPFWRVVQRLRCDKLLSLDLDYRHTPGRHLDLAGFDRLKFLALRPPGLIKHDDDESQTVSVEPPAVNSVPLHVQHLTYTNPAYSDDISDSHTLSSLISYRLPSLTTLRLSFHNFGAIASWDSQSKKLWNQFFQQHGSTLRTLQLNKACPGVEIFAHCPLIQSLTISQLHVQLGSLHVATLFARPTPHTNLRKIQIDYVDVLAPKRDRDAQFYQAFESLEFQDFPTLKELQVKSCEWPTSERELKKGKNRWVPVSEMLAKKFGIQLTDSEGVHWRPRLQVASGRKKTR